MAQRGREEDQGQEVDFLFLYSSCPCPWRHIDTASDVKPGLPPKDTVPSPITRSVGSIQDRLKENFSFGEDRQVKVIMIRKELIVQAEQTSSVNPFTRLLQTRYTHMW